MSSQEVLLDLGIAEDIFHTLSAMNAALKESGVSAHDRRELMRQMIKLKVAINKTHGVRSENMDLADSLLDTLAKFKK